MSFWGPQMDKLLQELDRRKFPYHGLSPSVFADRLDEMTGFQPRAHTDDPEVYARQWLERLRA